MHWILLRGLGRESAHWGGFIDDLARARPGDHFHAPDLPGMGQQHHQRAPASIAANRKCLQQACAHIPAPFGLIGLSMGAMVALDWAGASMDCGALVLMAPSSGLSPVWQRLQKGVWPSLMSLMLTKDVARREQRILALTSNHDPTDETLALWLEIQRCRPVRRSNVLRQIWAAGRFWPSPNRPELPGLVLASRGDRLVDWRCSDALAKHMGWPLALHDTAGHDLPLNAPHWVIHQINARFPPE